jgi:hypothetical protein
LKRVSDRDPKLCGIGRTEYRVPEIVQIDEREVSAEIVFRTVIYRYRPYTSTEFQGVFGVFAERCHCGVIDLPIPGLVVTLTDL